MGVKEPQATIIAAMLSAIHEGLEGSGANLGMAYSKLDRLPSNGIDPAEAAHYFEALSRVLPQIIIINPQFAPSRPVITPEMEAFVRKETKALEAVGARIIAREDEEFSRYGNAYGWFKPTLQFGALLKEVYKGEHDPGAIIGDYIKLLFPLDRTDRYLSKSTFTYAPRHKVEIGSVLHTLIFTLGSYLITNLELATRVKNAISVAFQHIIHPDEKDSSKFGVPIEEVVVAVLNTPSDFFYTWLYVWYFDECFTPEITSAELETVLLFYRIGEGSEPLYVRHKDLVRHQAPAVFYPTLDDKKEISYEMLSKFLFAARDQLGKCDEITFQILKLVCDGYTSYRRSKFGGTSAIGVWYLQDYSDFIFSIDGISLEMLDVVMLLANGNHSHSEFLLDLDPADYPSSPENFDRAFPYYQALYHRAVDEGFSELGSAVLSFYLIARAFKCGCRFGDLTKIVKLLDQVFRSPSPQCLKRTLEHIVVLIENFFPSEQLPQLAKRVFSQYLPPQATLHVLKGKSKLIAEESLVKELGEQRLAKLSKESTIFLEEFNRSWKQDYAIYGFGKKEYSDLITYNCKVVEHELVSAYYSVYNSQEYCSYHNQLKSCEKPANPTAVWLLKDFINYDRMPNELKSLLDSAKMKVHRDKQLCCDLKEIFTNYRNKAAHCSTITITKYSEFLEKFYHKRLLHRFIDSIVASS